MRCCLLITQQNVRKFEFHTCEYEYAVLIPMKLQMFFRIQDRHGFWHQHDWYVCVFVNCWGQWKPCHNFHKETSEIRHVSSCVSANLASMRNFLDNVRKDIVPDYDYRKKKIRINISYLNSPTEGTSSWFLKIFKIPSSVNLSWHLIGSKIVMIKN